MKKYLLLFIAGFLAVGMQAQVTFDEGEVTVTENDLSITDINNHNTVTSVQGGTFEWVRDIVEVTEGWQIAVCDVNLCYLPSVGNREFEMTAGQVGTMDVHAYTDGGEGAAEVKMTVTDVNDASNTTSATYYFNPSMLSSTGEVRVRTIKVFPNPATELFNVQDSENTISEVVIYNIIGRPMATYQATASGQYDISNLATGLYLVQLKEADGSIVRTVRLHKN